MTKFSITARTKSFLIKTLKRKDKDRLKYIRNAIIGLPMFFVGPIMDVNHIWPPKNYKKRYNPLHYYLVEKPLAVHGVFIPQQSPKDGSKFNTSNNEHKVIDKLTHNLPVDINKHFVDIGAGDGIDMSNTYLLAANGWHGLSLEIDVNKFAKMATTYQRLPNVDLVRARITPDNIVDLLEYSNVPKDFGVLNIDIDGYDFYVLEMVLKKYRPQIIVVEINPYIPASVSFSVKYSETFLWTGAYYFGMSLAMLKTLADKNNYKIVDAYAYSAFIMPIEIASGLPQFSLEELDNIVQSTCKDIDVNLRKKLNVSPSEALKYVSDVLFEGKHKGEYFIDVQRAQK